MTEINDKINKKNEILLIKKRQLALKKEEISIEKEKEMINVIKEMHIKRDFYKDNFFKSLGVLIFSILTFATSIMYTYYSYFHYSPPSNFIALDENNRVLEEIDLSLDVKTPEELNQWANDSIKEIFSYNYLTFDKQGVNIKHLFSEYSYKKFMGVFNNLRLQKKIEAQEAILEPYMLKTIKIDQSGDYNGRKAWQMKGVLLLNIHGKDGLERMKFNVSVVVTRTSFKDNKEGVVIEKIQLT
jgi:hypothetical protein